MLKNKTLLILFVLVVTGSFLRFFNLNWGAPYYFHPDERNIASSVSQLQFPDKMNPHFFAYGSLPIYAIYFIGLVTNFLSSCHLSLLTCFSAESLARMDHVSFEQAIINGRIFSATFSVLLIPLMFLLGKRLISKRAGSIAAILTTFLTGLIQFAHFATFEMWTTFFSVLLFIFSLYVSDKPTRKNILLLSITTGVIVSIKATNMLLVPIPLFALIAGIIKNKKQKRILASFIIPLLLRIIFMLLIASLIFVITNPFTFLDYSSFKGTMDYESGVALGKLPVFYTAEFFNSIPVLFQLLKVFPFLLNPLLTLIGSIGFILCLIISFKKRSLQFTLLVLITSLLIFPQSFFFVKWTRYMVPALPFLLLLSVFLLEKLSTININGKNVGIFPIWTTIITTMIFGTSYFVTAFVEKDTRVNASEFAKINIASTAPILADIYDMGIVTFNQNFTRIDLFNYYDLDNKSPESTPEVLENKLQYHDYIILPSQRIFSPRLTHPKLFLEGYSFYQELKTNEERFQKIYDTPCSIFCQITYLGDQVFRFEGTANTFERPPLQIYKIINNEK